MLRTRWSTLACVLAAVAALAMMLAAGPMAAAAGARGTTATATMTATATSTGAPVGSASVTRPLATYPWSQRLARAVSFTRAREGRISFAVIDEKGTVRGGYRMRRGFRSASVVKAMLMVCYLNRASVRNRPLTARDRALLDPMIRMSTNGPASAIYASGGSSCLPRLASRVGMPDFSTRPRWGLTNVNAIGVARLFHRIDLLVVERHRSYARYLLSHVVRSQRWGVPPAAPRGWRVYIKGGFVRAPGGGRVVNQGALLEKRRRRLSIAVLSYSPTHVYGTRTIQGIAARVLQGYGTYAPAPAAAAH